jgi:hypothetical protein
MADAEWGEYVGEGVGGSGEGADIPGFAGPP